MITGAGQVVVVQLLAALAAEAVHVATGTFVVLFGVQMVAVQLLAALAADATHEATPVGPVDSGEQVVVVQLLPCLLYTSRCV